LGVVRSLAIAAAVALLASVGAGSPLLAAPARDEAGTYSFAFQDADVSQVAEAILGQAVGVPYTIDPSVTTKLTFSIDRRLNKAQLLKAFEQVLAAQDIVLVRQGDSLLITTREKARGTAGVETGAQGVHAAGYQTVAVPLTYATPSEVAKALSAVSPNANVVVYVDDKNGLLILGGTGDELEAALTMVHLVDRSGLEAEKIRFFELSQASASTVAEDLANVLKASGVGNVTIVPLKRLNGLFAFARTDAQLDQVATWVAKLDIAPKETATSLWTYHPRNLSAESLAQTLDTVLLGEAQPASAPASPITQANVPNTTFQQPPHYGSGSAQPAPIGISSQTAAPASSGGTAPQVAFPSSGLGPIDDEPIRIGVERETNMLLVEASSTRWLQIQKILDQIDQPPGEVLIEASILEVTLNHDMRFGVDWSVLGDAGKLAIASIPSGTSVAPLLPGFAATFLSKNIQVAVNTLGSKTDVAVISAPKVIVLDNHTARLNVGDQVPVVTQSAEDTTAPGSPVVNSINYQNTGVIMSVTPRITGDNRIFLDISEAVSEAVQTNTSGIDSPTIQQREFDSSLVLADGGTVALGGLISDTHSKTDSGIPYLKDLKYVGDLFKTKDNNVMRTELIVLISAHIIRDQTGSDRALAMLKADMHDLASHGLFP
jgi:general secretion pathway protein D